MQCQLLNIQVCKIRDQALPAFDSLCTVEVHEPFTKAWPRTDTTQARRLRPAPNENKPADLQQHQHVQSLDDPLAPATENSSIHPAASDLGSKARGFLKVRIFNGVQLEETQKGGHKASLKPNLRASKPAFNPHQFHFYKFTNPTSINLTLSQPINLARQMINFTLVDFSIYPFHILN